MSLQKQVLTTDASSQDEFVISVCGTAVELEELGRYEEACAALESYWPGVGYYPQVENLGEGARFELVLRAGSLTGWIGSARQIEGSQETAKNLIHESVEGFQKLGQEVKKFEALTALAVCYWREGAIDNARALLLDVITNPASASQKVRSNALLNLAMVERKAGHLRESLEYLKQVESYIGESSNLAYKGRLHNARANCYFLISEGERKPEFLDKAILDWTSAAYYYELAEHTAYLASIENNLGYALMQTGEHQRAHGHLDKSRSLYASVGDRGRVAQVDDTRARLFIAERNYDAAEVVSKQSVDALEAGGEKSVQVESLITYGTALARLGKTIQADAVLKRACFIAEAGGDLQSAGLALIVLLEESISDNVEVTKVYAKADDLLASTDDLALINRLRSCARTLMERLEPDDKSTQEEVDLREGFSLKDATNAFQRRYVIKAMQLCGGKIKPAAKLLGVTRQAVQQMLRTRFKNVRFMQTTSTPKQSIIREEGEPGEDLLIAPDESLSSLGIHAEDVLVIFPKDEFEDGDPIAADVEDEIYIGYYRLDGERVYLDADYDEPLEVIGGVPNILGRVVGFIPASEKHKKNCKIRPA